MHGAAGRGRAVFRDRLQNFMNDYTYLKRARTGPGKLGSEVLWRFDIDRFRRRLGSDGIDQAAKYWITVSA